MTGQDMLHSQLKSDRKFKSLVMIYLLQTPLESDKLLKRKHATLFYWRWTKSVLWLNQLKLPYFPRITDSVWWSAIDLVKLKIVSLGIW